MLFTLLALSTVAPSVSFSGGTADRLVRSLANQGIVPVAVFADRDERLHSFIGIPVAQATPHRIASEAHLAAYGDSFGFSSKELPIDFFIRRYGDRQLSEQYLAQFSDAAKVSGKEGTITVSGRQSVWVRVEDLVSLALKKPVRSHWLWNEAVVAVTPGTFPEEKLLATVADALGAEFVTTPKEYRLDFVASRHRERALARLKDPSWTLKNATGYELHRAVAVAAIPSISDADWTAGYATPSTMWRFGEIAYNDPAFVQARRSFRQFTVDGSVGSPAVTQGGIHMLTLLDPKKKGRLLLFADGRIETEMPLVDEGKPGQGYLGF